MSFHPGMYWSSIAAYRACVSPSPPWKPSRKVFASAALTFALIGVELMLVTAVALFFSTFSSPFLSAALTMAIWVIGHFSEDLRTLESLGASPVLSMVGRGLYFVFPNLSPLNVTAAVVHAQPVSLQHMLLAGGSAGVYIAVLLVAATLIFERRDFK